MTNYSFDVYHLWRFRVVQRRDEHKNTTKISGHIV